MIQSKLIEKLRRKIEKYTGDINKGISVELRKEQKQETEKTIRKLKYIRRTVMLWEKANNLTFNGTESDVYTFNDLLRYCNELQFGETPLDVIRDGVFVAIGGSAVAPYDLREYLYLPSGLIEENKDIVNIHKAFEGFGEDIVQL